MGANTGASRYRLTYDPRENRVFTAGTLMETLYELGITYHAPSDRIRGIHALVGKGLATGRLRRAK